MQVDGRRTRHAEIDMLVQYRVAPSKAVMQPAGLKVGDFVHVRLLNSGDHRVHPSKGEQVVATNRHRAAGGVPCEANLT